MTIHNSGEHGHSNSVSVHSPSGGSSNGQMPQFSLPPSSAIFQQIGISNDEPSSAAALFMNPHAAAQAAALAATVAARHMAHFQVNSAGANQFTPPPTSDTPTGTQNPSNGATNTNSYTSSSSANSYDNSINSNGNGPNSVNIPAHSLQTFQANTSFSALGGHQAQEYSLQSSAKNNIGNPQQPPLQPQPTSGTLPPFPNVHHVALSAQAAAILAAGGFPPSAFFHPPAAAAAHAFAALVQQHLPQSLQQTHQQQLINQKSSNQQPEQSPHLQQPPPHPPTQSQPHHNPPPPPQKFMHPQQLQDNQSCVPSQQQPQQLFPTHPQRHQQSPHPQQNQQLSHPQPQQHQQEFQLQSNKPELQPQPQHQQHSVLKLQTLSQNHTSQQHFQSQNLTSQQQQQQPQFQHQHSSSPPVGQQSVSHQQLRQLQPHNHTSQQQQQQQLRQLQPQQQQHMSQQHSHERQVTYSPPRSQQQVPQSPSHQHQPQSAPSLDQSTTFHQPYQPLQQNAQNTQIVSQQPQLPQQQVKSPQQQVKSPQQHTSQQQPVQQKIQSPQRTSPSQQTQVNQTTLPTQTSSLSSPSPSHYKDLQQIHQPPKPLTECISTLPNNLNFSTLNPVNSQSALQHVLSSAVHSTNFQMISKSPAPAADAVASSVTSGVPQPPCVPTIAFPPHCHALPLPPIGQLARMPSVNNSAAAAAAASSNPLMLAQMQNWKLEQLEAHVQLLREANQIVPQPVALLLAEARRREEKRTAKRVANRKSACTSRARKKALVEEMTKMNAKLRRQALILALLPDLVIAITVDGEITFCSAQVERVLKHSIDDLIGANLSELLIPHSREALRRLVEKLVATDAAASFSGLENDHMKDDENHGNISSSANSNDNLSSTAVVSDQSERPFPLSIVKVDSHTHELATGEDVSDSSAAANNSSGDKASVVMTSVPNNLLSRSSTNSSKSQDHEFSQARTSSGASNRKVRDRNTSGQMLSSLQQQRQSSSGDESSTSSDANNLRKASESLNRKVRRHNAHWMNKKGQHNRIANKRYKDDVTGFSVTSNNADAKLSSLKHDPMMDNTPSEETEQTAKNTSNHSMSFSRYGDQSSSSSDSLLSGVEDKRLKTAKNSSNSRPSEMQNPENYSEDSGYRESAEPSTPSREDSSSSASETSNAIRHKPLAPTCNICLIKNDLTTIWCEVTSSIRTRILPDEIGDAISGSIQGVDTYDNKKIGSNSSKEFKIRKEDDKPVSVPEMEQVEMKELLLCLRPMHDGEERVGEELRFVPMFQRTEPSQLSLSTDEMNMAEITNNLRESASQNFSIAGSSEISENPNQADGTNSTNSASKSPQEFMRQRPMKKRHYQTERVVPLPISSTNTSSSDLTGQPEQKKSRSIAHKPEELDAEKTVAESLMLMCQHAK